MKKYSAELSIIFAAILVLGVALSSCKKDEEEEPAPSTLVATSNYANMIGPWWATLNGSVNPNNLTATVSFDYDTISSSYNKSVAGEPATISGSTLTTVIAHLWDLVPGKKYYFRIKVVTPTGTVYGTEKTFNTSDTTRSEILYNDELDYGTITDIEGNSYKTIQIGAQTWMAQNLETTKLNDGKDIPVVLVKSDWTALSSPGYCYYNYDSLSYGVLYNWYTVSTGRLCPEGWHVPADEEWTALIDYLGGEVDAGSLIKETGLSHWNSPNTGATNESGFTALPGGYRSNSGVFNNIRRFGYWWSSTEAPSSNDAYYRKVSYTYTNTDRSSSNKKSGLSVRCIKNNGD